jgi:hypothetical protein
MKKMLVILLLLGISTMLWAKPDPDIDDDETNYNAKECHPLGPVPSFGTSRDNINAKYEKKNFSLKTTAFLIHGMAPKFAKMAIQAKVLMSGCYRLGENGAFKRTQDAMNGGVYGVYTRAVGVKQEGWLVMGGVGASAAKVQLILSPAFLQERYADWRASSNDNMGTVPGATQANTNKGDDARSLWSKQGELSRNENFLGLTVNATGEAPKNNEQLTWEKIDLPGVLKCIVCQDKKVFEEMVDPKDRISDKKGTIPFNNGKVLVLLLNPKDKLLPKLKEAKVADANNLVR